MSFRWSAAVLLAALTFLSAAHAAPLPVDERGLGGSPALEGEGQAGRDALSVPGFAASKQRRHEGIETGEAQRRLDHDQNVQVLRDQPGKMQRRGAARREPTWQERGTSRGSFGEGASDAAGVAAFGNSSLVVQDADGGGLKKKPMEVDVCFSPPCPPPGPGQQPYRGTSLNSNPNPTP